MVRSRREDVLVHSLTPLRLGTSSAPPRSIRLQPLQELFTSTGHWKCAIPAPRLPLGHQFPTTATTTTHATGRRFLLADHVCCRRPLLRHSVEIREAPYVRTPTSSISLHQSCIDGAPWAGDELVIRSSSTASTAPHGSIVSASGQRSEPQTPSWSNPGRSVPLILNPRRCRPPCRRQARSS
jgi:hypothetical protein